MDKSLVNIGKLKEAIPLFLSQNNEKICSILPLVDILNMIEVCKLIGFLTLVKTYQSHTAENPYG